MKHEYTAILNHLRVKHNMTLTSYTQTYIKDSGDTQPSIDSTAEDDEINSDVDQYYLVEDPNDN